MGERHVERPGDAHQVAVPRVVLASLDALDRGPVDAGACGQLLLCEVSVESLCLNACPKCSAGIGDPLRLVCRHSTHAVACVIMSQQLL